MNKKYALCVGLNYPGTSAQLAGCVNDANDWSHLLASIGYEAYVVLEPTALELAIRLEYSVSKLGFGDRLVFTYSGHGTWVPDKDGDEADHRDEALVCADYMNGGILTDDELDAFFSTRKFGSHVFMLSDSCHSGTVTRMSTPVYERSMMRTPRFLPPTNFYNFSGGLEAKEMEATLTANRVSAPALISGCGDLEYSYDASFNGRPNGAFTRMAIDTWEQGITLNTWHKRIRAKLPTDWYPQSPELTASTYRKYGRAL